MSLAARGGQSHISAGLAGCQAETTLVAPSASVHTRAVFKVKANWHEAKWRHYPWSCGSRHLQAPDTWRLVLATARVSLPLQPGGGEQGAARKGQRTSSL